MTMRLETAAAIAVTTLVSAFAAAVFAAETHRVKLADIERGRYLVKIGACNDCHTPGYLAHGGKVDEKEWLTGDAMGWRGPWGTTYAANLRLYVQTMNENAWVERTKKGEARPPMPWFNLHAMTEDDLRAIYRYARAMGPAGKPAPAYVPPGEEPSTPYFSFEPQMPRAEKVSSRR